MINHNHGGDHGYSGSHGYHCYCHDSPYLVTHRVLPLICIGPPRGSQRLGVLLIASTCLVVVLGSWWGVWRGVSLERTSALRGRQVNLLSEEPTDRNAGTSTAVCLLRVLHVMDSGEVAV